MWEKASYFAVGNYVLDYRNTAISAATSTVRHDQTRSGKKKGEKIWKKIMPCEESRGSVPILSQIQFWSMMPIWLGFGSLIRFLFVLFLSA